MKECIIDDAVSWGATNYVKCESIIFWLINKYYKWGPRPISLEENVLYRYQFEVLVVLSSLHPLRSFNFLFKSECYLILCHYQFNCICNISWKPFVVYNYQYLKIASRRQTFLNFCFPYPFLCSTFFKEFQTVPSKLKQTTPLLPLIQHTNFFYTYTQVHF